ncbi:MAG: hypothetical protein JXA99_07725 [Candidatus Lokiarchaeota archaeon]|nr:hypothetical protein [Candidatus Lokiarchaeota archaeon]
MEKTSEDEQPKFLIEHIIFEKSLHFNYGTINLNYYELKNINKNSNRADNTDLLDIYILYSSDCTSNISNSTLYNVIIITSFLLLSSILMVITSKKGLKKHDFSELKNLNTYYQISFQTQAEIEDIFIDLIKDYLDKNKCFSFEKILPYLLNRINKMNINLNSNGIKEILKCLEDKKIISDGSKLIKSNILENINRNIIYEFIKQNPGTYLNDIVISLDLNIFIAKWHIDMLIKFNLIQELKVYSKKLYFDLNINKELKELYYLLSNKKSNNIIQYLKSNDLGTTIYQITKELKMHFNTVKKYLSKLEENNLIVLKKCSDKKLYFLNFKLIEEIIK